MTFGWQTDKKGGYSVRVHLCVFCTKALCICHCWSTSPRWMTIKPSVALAGSRYPPTWWVLRDRFFDGRHEQTQPKRAHNDLEQDTAKKEGEVRGRPLIISPLHSHWTSAWRLSLLVWVSWKESRLLQEAGCKWTRVWSLDLKGKAAADFLMVVKARLLTALTVHLRIHIYILCMYICLVIHMYYIYRYNLDTKI